MSALTEVLNRFRIAFSIDLRAMAAFRICLGMVIIADLIIRSFDMRDFYTNDGVMPLRLWPIATNSLHWSFHTMSGNLAFQVILFSLAAVIAVCLIVGYRTKLMSVLSWMFLVSLVNRDHFVLQAGDLLLVIMAFWSMFLPLNARYSVDAALNKQYQKNPNHHPPENQQYFSVATIAVLLQVLYLYFFTAILKYGAPWRETFDAAFYAVSLEQFATPIGDFVRNYPAFLKLSTVFVLVLEFVALFTALSPVFHVPLRIITVSLLFLLHLGFLLMLHIGLFPLVDFTALTLLIPAAVWNWFGRKRDTKSLERITLYYDEDCGFCKKTCLVLREFCLTRGTRILPAQEDPVAGPLLERENTWVVKDEHGQLHTHWHAVQYVVSKRAWLKPLAWVMKIPPLMSAGNKLYQKIGNNRDALGGFTERFLPYRPVRLKAGVLNHLVAAFFLYVVTTVNIAGVKNSGIVKPHHVTVAERTARLDQRWGMFAPHPLTYSIYPVVSGELRDGSKVDLWRNISEPPAWTADDMGYGAYPGYRWRKFFERVNSGSKTVLSAYGDYLCRRWNQPSRSRSKQLGIVEIWSVRRKTNVENKPKEETRKRLWVHWCFPEFKPQPVKKTENQ